MFISKIIYISSTCYLFLVHLKLYSLHHIINQHSKYSTNFQWVTKPVVTNDKCVWGTGPFKWGPSQITANMICAGDADGGESTCKGDSGGPLVVPKSSTDDTAVVIGATSFGPGHGCGKPGLPAVYAYVTRYLNWIKPQMES